MGPTLRRDGDVFVLELGSDENRFNPDACAQLAAALTDVEAATAAGEQVALVTTGVGKFFSNGIDLDWMLGDEARADPATIPDFIASMAFRQCQ